MKEPMIKRIDELFISEEAKETLKTVYGMSSSKHVNIKSSIPSILVTADEGCGYSTFSKTYGDIISDSSLLKIRGVKTYIELVFPKDNERDEKMFFSSPLLASSIKNRFYGTMSISFKEFEGNDLIGSESLERLMKFIAANRSNIYFVFHVLPEFSATKHLIKLLGNTLNISEVILDKPDKEKSFKYVMDGLKRQGYSINKADLNRFKELISVVMEDKMYSGYRSFNNLIDRINYEVIKNGHSPDEPIEKEVINSVMERYNNEAGFGMSEKRVMGFRA